MLDSEVELKAELDELKSLVDLYKQSNPNWNVNKEEQKKEETEKAASQEADLNNAVAAAFTTFAMMHHVKKNASFFKECSGKNAASVKELMDCFRKAKRADIGSADVLTGTQEFVKKICETDFSFVAKCFEPAAIEAAKAAKNKKAEPKVEAVVEAKPEVVEEVKAEEAAPVKEEVTEAEPIATVATEANEEEHHQKREDQPRRGGRGGRGRGG